MGFFFGEKRQILFFIEGFFIFISPGEIKMKKSFSPGEIRMKQNFQGQ